MGRAEPDVRPPGTAIPSATAKSILVVEIPLAAIAVGLQRSGDWLAARRSDQCAAPAANHRCAVAVGLLTAIAAREFQLLKLILHSELRRRAASCRALPCTSSFVCGPKFITSPVKVW